MALSAKLRRNNGSECQIVYDGPECQTMSDNSECQTVEKWWWLWTSNSGEMMTLNA